MWMCECVNEWVWTCEWVNVNVWMSDCDCVNVWMSDCDCDCVNVWERECVRKKCTHPPVKQINANLFPKCFFVLLSCVCVCVVNFAEIYCYVFNLWYVICLFSYINAGKEMNHPRRHGDSLTHSLTHSQTPDTLRKQKHSHSFTHSILFFKKIIQKSAAHATKSKAMVVFFPSAGSENI